MWSFVGEKLKLHPLPSLLWAAAPRWIAPSCRYPYSAEQAFTQRGQVLRAPGAAESRRTPLIATSKNQESNSNLTSTGNKYNTERLGAYGTAEQGVYRCSFKWLTKHHNNVSAVTTASQKHIWRISVLTCTLEYWTQKNKSTCCLIQ